MSNITTEQAQERVAETLIRQDERRRVRLEIAELAEEARKDERRKVWLEAAEMAEKIAEEQDLHDEELGEGERDHRGIRGDELRYFATRLRAKAEEEQ